MIKDFWKALSAAPVSRSLQGQQQGLPAFKYFTGRNTNPKTLCNMAAARGSSPTSPQPARYQVN